MIKVRFLADYRGILTQELFYGAGEVVEFDDAQAEDLLAAGRVVNAKDKPRPKAEPAVEEIKPEPETESVVMSKPKRKKKVKK